jgi:hypothetical protein
VLIHTGGYQRQGAGLTEHRSNPYRYVVLRVCFVHTPMPFVRLPEQMPNRASACYFPLLQRAEAHLSIVLE